MGARLVSIEGDLWRWDGVIVRAKAPKPAAVRLSQRTRLDDLETEIDKLKPELSRAQNTLAAAAQAQKRHEDDVRAARLKIPDLERTLRGQQIKLDELQKLRPVLRPVVWRWLKPWPASKTVCPKPQTHLRRYAPGSQPLRITLPLVIHLTGPDKTLK